MDAHKLWMLRDFIGTNKVLFRIPVYQRNYAVEKGRYCVLMVFVIQYMVYKRDTINYWLFFGV